MKKKDLYLIIAIVLAGIMSFSILYSKVNKKTPDESSNTIIGVAWDRSESTALTRLTTKNDDIVTTNIDVEPVPGVGEESGSSPFDKYYPWKAMKEYNVIDNNIAYSSDDAEFSRTAYDTVVYIPTFYYKVVDTEESRCFYVSAKPADGFAKHPGSNNYVAKYNTSNNVSSDRLTLPTDDVIALNSVSGQMPLTNITRGDVRTNARAKGENWSQYDFATWNAIQMLYLVEYADWDVQQKIGLGITFEEYETTDNHIHATGETDTMAYHTGRAAGEDGKTQVKYRHIEGLWGNVCEWVDGINVNEKATYISLDYKNYADDTDQGYTATGVSLPETGRIKNVGHSEAFPWAFIPSESIQATDYENFIYVPDKVCSGTGWRILYTSNNSSGDYLAGLFRFSCSSASTRYHATYGCRLVYHGE